MFRTSVFMSVVIAGGLAFHAAAQSSSAVLFYDTTGSEPTSRMGWSGDAESGHFFIETPDDNSPVKVDQGNLEVDGTVRATKFIGDGSGLTNLPEQSGETGTDDITGLSDSLAAKAPLSHEHSFDEVTGDIPESRIPNGAYMIDTVGDSGQVWKSDGNGRGYWGTDMVGDGSGNEITWTNVQGLQEQLDIKADTSQVDALEADVSALQSRGAGVPQDEFDSAIAALSDSVGTKVDTSDLSAFKTQVYTKTEANGRFADDEHTHGSSDIVNGSIVDADISSYARISGKKVDPTFEHQDISTRKNLEVYPGGSQDTSTHAIFNVGYEGTNSLALVLSSRTAPADTNMLCLWNLNNRDMKLFVPLYVDTIDAYWGYAGTPIQVKHSMNVQGTLTATSCCSPSDRRLKKNVKPLENCLQMVNSLQGVSYKWRDDKKPKETQIGLIAQEVKSVIPEVVKTDHEGMQSVDYSKLTAVLIEAVKEQQEQIEGLKEELSIQKKRTDDILSDNLSGRQIRED